jgi:regulator of replication initiation timing
MGRRKRDMPTFVEWDKLNAQLNTLRHMTIPAKDQQITALERALRTQTDENERLQHENTKLQDRLDYLLRFHREVSRG